MKIKNFWKFLPHKIIKSKYKNIKYKIIIASITITILFWIISGFYIINESEEGVVMTLGKFRQFAYSGLHWKKTFIDKLKVINVRNIHKMTILDTILTKDENLIEIKMQLQYKINNPKKYLFSTTYPEHNIKQITNNLLSFIVGNYDIDYILTKQRFLLYSDLLKEIKKNVKLYDIGIDVLDIVFQKIDFPKALKSVFNNYFTASENREKCIKNAEEYANKVQFKANRKIRRILRDAKIYKIQSILKTQSEVIRFLKIFSQYKISKNMVYKNFYLKMIKEIFSSMNTILISKNYNIILDSKLKKFFIEKMFNEKDTVKFLTKN